MLFKKDKYIIKVNHGYGEKKTDNLRGIINNLIIEPEQEQVMYDISIIDEDNDEIMFWNDIVGKVSLFCHIPAGKCTQESIKVILKNVSHNIDFKIILLTREK